MSTTTQPQVSSSFVLKPQPTYDFTKRKRWANLLLTELVDDITFVLSPTGKVLFCGAAVTELLGWRDVELLDVNFLELINATDQARFRAAFNDSLQKHTEFNILLRLRGSDMSLSYDNTSVPHYVLFDIKCYPHVILEGELETKCLFAMASPYPSRNTAMRDTIIDLKVENDRLQRKVAEYRARIPRDALPSTQNPQGSSMYATSSLHSQRHIPPGGGLQKGVESSNAYLSSSSMINSQMEDLLTSGPKSMEFSSLLYGSNSTNSEEPADEGSKKKKLKRAHNAEQYVCVTCGRTDSPEWRKGPSGPKTLCNACGLRWAKQMRKIDEPAEGVSLANNAES